MKKAAMCSSRKLGTPSTKHRLQSRTSTPMSQMRSNGTNTGRSNSKDCTLSVVGRPMRLSRKRREQLVLGYVRAMKGRLPRSLNEVLTKMAALMGGPVGESELRRAIQLALRQSGRSGAEFERKMRAQRRERLADRIAEG